MKLLCNICLEEIKGIKNIHSCNRCIQGHLDVYVCNLNTLCKECYMKHKEAHQNKEDKNDVVVIDLDLHKAIKKRAKGNGTFF